ncbi:MAG: hypothetical protein ACRCXZ_01435 [Patescibacteria group bacterium]
MNREMKDYFVFALANSNDYGYKKKTNVDFTKISNANAQNPIYVSSSQNPSMLVYGQYYLFEIDHIYASILEPKNKDDYIKLTKSIDKNLFKLSLSNEPILQSNNSRFLLYFYLSFFSFIGLLTYTFAYLLQDNQWIHSIYTMTYKKNPSFTNIYNFLPFSSLGTFSMLILLILSLVLSFRPLNKIFILLMVPLVIVFGVYCSLASLISYVLYNKYYTFENGTNIFLAYFPLVVVMCLILCFSIPKVINYTLKIMKVYIMYKQK